MLPKWLRMPRGGPEVEVGVGCLVPVALAIAVLVGLGVVVGTHLGRSETPAQVTVRVIDDGAAGGPAVVSTTVVPLR
jgi:hypothetical protein